ncbi:glyoxalase [Escherichia coli]|nr:glyoxalase [Escherichia coli]
MCIHLNLMIFTKIIRGFISALRVKNASFLCGISSFHHDVFGER